MFDPDDFEMELCVPVGSLPGEPRRDRSPRTGRGDHGRHHAPGTLRTRSRRLTTVLEAWVKENGYRYTGPAREIYLNDPSQVPESELLTEVQFPVEKA